MDNSRRASLVSIMRILEDIAIQHSEDVNLGLDFYEQENVGWMLSRWDINIYRFPMFKETIKVVTEPQAMNKFYANRKYHIYSETGDLLIEANSLWIFVNTLTRRPIQIAEFIYERYSVNPNDNFVFTKLEDIALPSLYQNEKEYLVMSDAIDTNQHTNNTQYIFWATDTLPKEIKQNYCPAHVLVNYMKETKEGDNVVSSAFTETSNEKVISLHRLTSGDKDVCKVKIEWLRQ